MATGDTQDIFERLVGLLPPWFGDFSPNRDAFLEGGAATVDSFAYDFYAYAKIQTRIKTATGEFLDLISKDFFGKSLPRRALETDESFRKRILATLLREKATRKGISDAIKNLTGFTPRMIELWRPIDCGGYNVVSSLAYNTFGCYGSGNYAYQGFIDVYVKFGQGMSQFSGYQSYYGGYGTHGGKSYLYYGNDKYVGDYISDKEIYDLINLVKAEGTKIWVRINRGSQLPVPQKMLDLNFKEITDNGDEPILGG